MRIKLTDATVRRLSEPGEYWDTLLPGLGLRVGKRARTWVVATRRPSSRNPVRLKIGRYPDIGLADARDKARAIMADGAPPEPVPLRDAIDAFLEHGRTKRGRPLRQNTLDQYRRMLGATYLGPLHGRAVQDIRRRDVAARIAEVARTSGAPTASLVRSMLARLFAWAIEVGYLEHNPVTGSPGYEVPKRKRVLSDAELRALWQAADPTDEFGLILRVLTWTGARRSEVGAMRWSEISPRSQPILWTVPGDRAKNHRPLILPLPHQAAAALERWPRIVGRDHLFGVRSPRGFTAWDDAKAELDDRLRFNEPWQLRDIRRTVETRLAGLGTPKEIRSRILNHDLGELEETYNVHEYLSEKREALQLWANELDRITAPTAQVPTH